MSDIEVVTFKKYTEGTLVSINIVLDEKEALVFEDIWFNKVKGIQPPLTGSYKNGFSLFIPWILKEDDTL